jgi:hypothetical protein
MKNREERATKSLPQGELFRVSKLKKTIDKRANEKVRKEFSATGDCKIYS